MQRWLRTIPLRVRTVLWKNSIETDLCDEMQFHLEQRVEELVLQGVSRRQAEQTARHEMRLEREMERCRDVRAGQGLERLRADVVFGWRQLRKRKITTTAAVLSLGLAIGATMVAFRLIDPLFLRSLPIAHPERLYAVEYSGMNLSGRPIVDPVSTYPEMTAMHDAVKGQAQVLGVGYQTADVMLDNATEKINMAFVSGDTFAAFGLQPAVGRLLMSQDDLVSGGSPLAVISYDYWTRRFGRDAKAVGSTFRWDDTVYEIVGVAPKGFDGTQPGTMMDIYVPLTMNSLTKQPDVAWFCTFVMAAPGVNVEELTGRLNAADHAARVETWKLLSRRFPDAPKQMVDSYVGQKVKLAQASTDISNLREKYGRPLMVFSVLIGMILLIACVNVANLMVGQAATRAREMAVRVSLGAGRGRLVRLLMVESAMIGLAAAALGMLFTWWATPLAASRISFYDPRIRLSLEPDWIVMAFGIALTVLLPVLFGLMPALRASRVQPISALKGGEEPGGGMSWMRGMVATQVAFCFVVLFVAALFAGTLESLRTKPTGFSTRGVLLLDARTQGKTGVPLTKWEQTADAMRAVPGVERVSVAGGRLMDGSVTTTFISANGEPAAKIPAYTRHISPGLLETMKIPLLAGRDFLASDTNPGQALVNEEFARQYFGGASPVGNHFSFVTNGNGPLDRQSTFEVVGLVSNTLYDNLRGDPPPTAYLPMQTLSKNGAPQPLHYGVFVVRTQGSQLAMAETLRKIAEQMLPELSVGVARTQQELIDGQMVHERLLAALGGFFAVVALLLAAIGLYGVLHYSVVQREREIGIRIALGAAAANIARVVTVRVVAMVFVGVGVGLAAGLASVRFVQTLLYGVRGTDLSMMALPALVLLAAVMCAAAPAVIRAVRLDPARMLRAE